MARINVDDNVESQIEYRNLLKLLGGDDDRALGMLVRFWRLAQEYWGRGKLIPADQMELWDFQPLIESKWAIVLEDGVYAKGAEERFAWYRQAIENGKKGGRPKFADSVHNPKSGQIQIEKMKSSKMGDYPMGFKNNPEVISANPLAPVPAPIPIPILVKNKKGDLITLTLQEKVNQFIDQYKKSFQMVYGIQASPVISRQVNCQIILYLREHSIARSCEMIQAYCEMNDAWFVKKGHDFATFLSNQNIIAIFLDTKKTRNQGLGNFENLWSEVLSKLKIDGES